MAVYGRVFRHLAGISMASAERHDPPKGDGRRRGTVYPTAVKKTSAHHPDMKDPSGGGGIIGYLGNLRL